MRQRMPPLNGLRAFEAAARHLSFVKAADELAVTAGAVSHQVKTLEDYLGVQLFRRQARGIRMTEAGQDVLPLLRDAFDRMEQVSDRLDAHRTKGTLVVSAAPTFAGKWLVPRIETFHDRHPEIEVRIDAAKRVVDFAREDVDVAIRFGAGEWPGLRAWPLFDRPDEIFPVCAPAGPDRTRAPLDQPSDLAGQVLLHADWKAGGRTWPNWSDWLAAAGAEGVDGARGPHFTTWALALQAAQAGHGVALGSRTLVDAELAAGTLVRPFKETLTAPAELGFYLVCPAATADRPKIRAFCVWMREAAGAQDLR
jgi:LysR family glycine cleavage system transcriptional activator